eukprot:1244668-Amphidinium_carterae.2
MELLLLPRARNLLSLHGKAIRVTGSQEAFRNPVWAPKQTKTFKEEINAVAMYDNPNSYYVHAFGAMGSHSGVDTDAMKLLQPSAEVQGSGLLSSTGTT